MYDLHRLYNRHCVLGMGIRSGGGAMRHGIANTDINTKKYSAPQDKEPASCEQRKRREPATTTTCKHCGKEFSVHAYKLLEGKGNYCSKLCQHAARRKGNEYSCQRCGKAFYSTTRRRDLQGRGKYCSKECAYGTLLIHCDFCGKEISKAPSLFHGHDRHYCNHRCKSAAKVKYPKEVRTLVDREKGLWRVHYGTKTITNQTSKRLLAYSQLASRVIAGKISKLAISDIISKIEKGETYAAYE